MPNAGTVLIIEDEPDVLDDHEEALQNYGQKYGKEYQIYKATNLETADSMLREFKPDIVILDLGFGRSGPGEGLEFLKKIREYDAMIKVIVVTKYGDTNTGLTAIESGACNFIDKFKSSYHELPIMVNAAYEKLQLERELERLKQEKISQIGGYPYGPDQMIVGTSEAMEKLYKQIEQVAPTNATVLILGESGTGKELVAQAIHNKSERTNKPFVPVACGKTSNELLESELFGHEKGAYTGATERRKGKFEQANRGTIFLDEIPELDKSSQVKLLRVLQEKEFERMGGKQIIKVDVRVLAATNKNLEQAVKDGVFREDLYYRLNVCTLSVPPLRERKSDIPILAKYFLNKYKENNKNLKGFQETAMALLTTYFWPGNVRELENCIQRAVISATNDWISVNELKMDELKKFAGKNLPIDELVDKYEKALILDALDRNDWNQSAAARELDIIESGLRYKMKKHGILRTDSSDLRNL